MKFIALSTGSILETNNPFVIEQMQRSDAYKEYVEKKAEPKKETKKPVKAEE